MKKNLTLITIIVLFFAIFLIVDTASAKCLNQYSISLTTEIYPTIYEDDNLSHEIIVDGNVLEGIITEELDSENSIVEEYELISSLPLYENTVLGSEITPDCLGGGSGGGGIGGGSSGFGNLNTTLIPSSKKVQVLRSLPITWTRYSDPYYKFIEVRYNGLARVKIHPPDRVTNYHHVHLYNSYGQSLDRFGRVVDYRSQAAHIPYLRY
ncbi:hypothetical protein ACOI1C_07500 [Bacillus sp. DJP31]|uniref:hypothetical protein n=1 Tax=Bacillus sp. DJP31 TaxID=3409789 RepID=UPI003BB5F381